MLWKTSKDRLIEFLQAQLQARFDELKETRSFVDQYSELAREAVALASMAVSQLPENKQNAKLTDDPYKPRTMAAYVQRLSEMSYKRAASKGKNLVAEMPPPGAIKPNGVA